MLNLPARKADLIEELRKLSLKPFECHYFGAQVLKIQLNTLQDPNRSDVR